MNALIIFIKNPVLGKVKTRLARTMGDTKALEIYHNLSRITRDNVLTLKDVKLYLFYSDFIDLDDDWSNELFTKCLQTGHDLGERMLNAFSEVLTNHPKACIIGSDCPTLSPLIMESAFTSLNKYDFVIGPSSDGGYYLLGMNLMPPPQYLFENIAWSTHIVFSETLHRIKKAEKSAHLLPILTDIDEEKDWLDYLN